MKDTILVSYLNFHLKGFPLRNGTECVRTKKRVKQLDTRKYCYRPTPLRGAKNVTRWEISENDFGSLEFVTDRAKRSYVAYSEQLKDLYGDVDCDDLALWKSLHPKCKGRKMFGIGSSDPDFLVTGKQSSRICSSNDDARHSQEIFVGLC
ncbi:uncharacterized protein LOC110883032 isoform X2 [Helianthus annuus]|uniref:uncharacterized protein LOC110883032 isoform X2 n=1 Tax=Helianthus annuus TaxID=4232 RepID=UPI0016531F3A|nr:uncharacterized protein LOC110883032 isoform X2 [Helianthus annuus]